MFTSTKLCIGVLLLYWWTSTIDCSSDKLCTSLQLGTEQVLLITPVSAQRFLLITSGRFVFDLPLASWNSTARKLYLANSVSLKDKWPQLEQEMSYLAPTCSSNSFVVAIGDSNRYVHLWINQVGYSRAFDLNKQTMAHLGLVNVTSQLSAIISNSDDVMNFETLYGHNLLRYKLDDSFWTSRVAVQVEAQSVRYICSTSWANRISISERDCAPGQWIHWNVQAGFIDKDKTMYFFDDNIVRALGATSHPNQFNLTNLPLTDFFVCDQWSTSNSTATMQHSSSHQLAIFLVLVTVILVSTTVIVAILYCYFCQEKPNTNGLARSSIQPASGSKRRTSCKPATSKLPKGSSRWAETKIRTSTGNGKKQQKRTSATTTPVHHKVTTSRRKQPKMSRTSTIKPKVNKSTTKPIKQSQSISKRSVNEQKALSKRIYEACNLGFN